jgi:hypothetical protein
MIASLNPPHCRVHFDAAGSFRIERTTPAWRLHPPPSCTRGRRSQALAKINDRSQLDIAAEADGFAALAAAAPGFRSHCAGDKRARQCSSCSSI